MVRVGAHFPGEGRGLRGSGLVPPGRGAVLWLLGSATQRKMDALRLPVIHRPGNIHHFYGPHQPLFSLLPKPDENPGVGTALINLG